MKTWVSLLIYVVILVFSLVTNTYAQSNLPIWQPETGSGSYEFYISDVIQHKIFYINGKKFIAESTCSDWEKGDNILFHTPAEFAGCFKTTVYNRTKADTCTLVCGK